MRWGRAAWGLLGAVAVAAAAGVAAWVWVGRADFAALAAGSASAALWRAVPFGAKLRFEAQGSTPGFDGIMLALLDMRGGVGTLSPLRVRSAYETIAGYGRFDLNRRVLDLSIGSEAETTSSYALDAPVRVSGAFARPDVRPARWSGAGRAALASMDALAQLPPGLQAVARRSGCSRR